MHRPTALLRQLLILELIQAYSARELGRVKAEMPADGLEVIERSHERMTGATIRHGGGEFIPIILRNVGR